MMKTDVVNERLNIPMNLKVGFQSRKDTYSGKLAYVTYLDKKGKIAKHLSWEGWRSKEMDVEEYENKPTEGFVLNKRVGGYKSGWNFRQTKCRVYDPRGFEVEISMENLLFILQECTSTKGKGLEGAFVYAWQGPELILLPVDTEDYRASMQLIEKKEKLSVRDLKLGAAYKGKDSEYLIYIGKQEWYIWAYQEGEAYRDRYYMTREVWKEVRKSKLPTFVDINAREFRGYKDIGNLDYLIETDVISLDDIETYVENFKTTAAYKTQFITELAINDSLEKWDAYMEGDDKYSWGQPLIIKRPQDNYITCLRGRKNYEYQGLQYSQWLYKRGITSYSTREERNAAEEEFNNNSILKISYTITSYITFENGKLKTENPRENGMTIIINDNDWKYISDGDYSNHSFLTDEGEKIKFWYNENLSRGKISFNENAPLPEL